MKALLRTPAGFLLAAGATLAGSWWLTSHLAPEDTAPAGRRTPLPRAEVVAHAASESPAPAQETDVGPSPSAEPARSLAELGIAEFSYRGPDAAASVGAATDKLISKLDKKITAAQNKIAKLQAKDVKLNADLAQAQVDLVDAQATLALVQNLLALAQQDLADALTLPEGTEQEIADKKAAVKMAELGVKLATKEVKSYTNLVNKLNSTIAKLGTQIVKNDAATVVQQDLVVELQAEVAFLQVPFDFDVLDDVPFQLRVEDGLGDPVARARVLVAAPLVPKGAKPIETLTSGRVYWQGFTDAAGVCTTNLRLPQPVDLVDVVVAESAYVGPYSQEKLRERWGPFAPAARVHHDRSALADSTIVLTADGSP